MKRINAPFAVVLACAILLCAVAFAQVESMKLLTPDVGWAANRQRLLWTASGGSEWKEITPPKPSAGEHIEAVFFLDPSTGWVLWSQRAEPQPRFDVSATSDAGASWSTVRISVLALEPSGTPLADSGRMFFLDGNKGWINLGVQGGAAFHPGAMLMTEDSGKTWNWVPKGAGTSGAVYFSTSNDGWILSPAGDELAGTHDGARTWQDIKLLPPSVAEVHGEYNTTYHLPTFQNSMHGYIEVEFSYGSEFSSGARSVRVLFSTNDGGRTWKFGRKLPEVTLTQFASSAMETGSDAAASEVTDDVWTAASVRGGKTLALTRVPLTPGQAEAATMHFDVSKYQGLYGLGHSEEISFIDALHGWVLPGRLLATNDGGATWADLTPSQLVPPARPTITVPVQPQLIPNKPKASLSGVRPAYPFTSSADLSIHLGFDIYSVMLSSNMQTWWNSSPYFDTNIYLPGSPNGHTDKNLTAAWVSAVQKQGWGVIVSWVGHQSPCACKPGTGTYPNCTPYGSLINSNTTTAKSQGVQEADSAIASLKNLQSQSTSIALGTIIYDDIESYTPSTTCSPPVQAFLNGWVSEMHTKGYQAGVYANPSPISSDVSKVSPLPDDIWVAKYDNRLTTFGLGFSDSLWPKDQRMHQVQQNLSQSFGGSTQFSVDPDIDDAQIAAGLGAKGYSSFTFSQIAYPSAAQTVPQGINDLNSSGGFINATQTGEIVGAYYNSTGPVNAFLDNSGTFTNVNDPSATNGSVAYDISNQKYIIGTYGSSLQGYLKKGTAAPTNINCTGASETYGVGINDDAQIVGFDLDSAGLHGYFLKTSTGTCQLYDGLYPNNAQAIGINGNGQIVGFYNDGSQYHGFLWNADTDGSITTLDIAGTTGTQLFYINNNGQITGQYRNSSGSWQSFLYEEATDSYLLLPDDPSACSGCSGVIGVNDSAQVTGQYTTTISGLTQGFLATPK